MNFYAFNIGDYAGATRHLSWDEDMAYRRMLDAYYSREAPLPLDRRQVYRLVGAAEERQREAVNAVLEEFFEQREDGWHNNRADEEIAKAAEKSSVRAEKRENERERQRRHRSRRAELFDILRDRDIVPSFDTPTKELEALVAQKPVTRDRSLQDLSKNREQTNNADVQRDTANVTSDRATVTRHVTRDKSDVTPDITANNPNPNPNPKIEDDGKIARATPANQELFKRVEDTLRAIKELDGHPVAINPVIAPIFRLVVDQGLDLDTQIVPSIRRQAITSKRPLKLWTYFVDGILADATTPPAGAPANGQPPRRRPSASQDLADAFERVKAHVSGRDPGP